MTNDKDLFVQFIFKEKESMLKILNNCIVYFTKPGCSTKGEIRICALLDTHTIFFFFWEKITQHFKDDLLHDVSCFEMFSVM